MRKSLLVLLSFILISSFAFADGLTAERILNLQANHKKAMQYNGHMYMWKKESCSFAQVGEKVVSIVRGKQEINFYTEYKGSKIYTHLTISKGEKQHEYAFTFDSKLTTDKGNTYEYSVTYTYNFGDTPGFKVKVYGDKRWNLEKCFDCVVCAVGKIKDLYNAYKECGTNFSCWIDKFPHLIDLYHCVVDNCIACFKDQ